MINKSEELKEARKEIMKKLDDIKSMFGINIREDGVLELEQPISLTEALANLKTKDYEKFKEITANALSDFFSGDMGEFEKYEEDIYHLSQSTPKGRYKLDFEIETYFGNCDTLCITPTIEGITIHMAMED